MKIKHLINVTLFISYYIMITTKNQKFSGFH